MILLALACSTGVPDGLNGAMPPCPERPNCVHSEASATDTHHIEPIAVVGDPDVFWETLDAAVLAMPRTERISDGPEIRHYVFTTAVMRFSDDVQFRLDRTAGVVHVRSASRVGYDDLGVNRGRVETIRDALTAP